MPREEYIYLDTKGPLFCLEAKTGKLIWKTHLVDDLGGRCPTWGYSGAPLFYKDTIIVQTGAKNGSLVALDAESGMRFGVVEEQKLVTQVRISVIPTPRK